MLHPAVAIVEGGIGRCTGFVAARNRIVTVSYVLDVDAEQDPDLHVLFPDGRRESAAEGPPK